MTQAFLYPTSAELKEIEQDLLPRLEADRPVFEFFPTTEVDEAELMWEQRDDYTGLQQVRGLNGEFAKVRRVGIARYLMEPGVYGEHQPLDEAMLTKRRQIGTFASPIDISDLVAPVQDQLLQRRLDRIEWMIWTLISTGTFSVAGPNGAILHGDSYPLQQYNALTPWFNQTSSTPAADFRKAKLLGRGHSVDFGAKAQAWMNQTTFNYLALNFNQQDLYGRRVEGLATPNNLKDISKLLQGDDLPEIVVYDRGYRDDTLVNVPGGGPQNGLFNLFIPNNTVIIVGKRPGNQPVGDYAYTRNVNNPDLGPGPYMEVIDSRERGSKPPPREIDVYDGHNGGTRIYYPSAIIVMHV